MRNFDVSGLDRSALEQAYEIVLTQKVILEHKLENVKKAAAVAACAIRDGVVDQEEAARGMENVVYYCEAKIKLEDELDEEKGILDLVNNHIEEIKEFAISKRAERKKEKKHFVVYTDGDFDLSLSNVFCSHKKYLSEKQFKSENDKSWLPLGKLLDDKDFKPENYIN